jgi:hypothetical protein
MKKIKFIPLALLLIGLSSYSQQLTCADFKIGKFYIPASEELTKYTVISNDSIKEFTHEIDTTIKKYIVIRQENTQIEWINGIDNGTPEYEIIEWIDDCTYRLTYDSLKTNLSEEKKWVNENNGIIVSKIKIEGKCMFYKSTMTTTDGQEISSDGTICLE